MFTNEQDEIAQAATEYMDASPFVFLATSYGGKPFIRTVSPFAVKEINVYFSALKTSAFCKRYQSWRALCTAP